MRLPPSSSSWMPLQQPRPEPRALARRMAPPSPMWLRERLRRVRAGLMALGAPNDAVSRITSDPVPASPIPSPAISSALSSLRPTGALALSPAIAQDDGGQWTSVAPQTCDCTTVLTPSAVRGGWSSGVVEYTKFSNSEQTKQKVCHDKNAVIRPT